MGIKRLDRHRRVLIMGLGLFGGGAGAAQFWEELGAEVTVTDLRSETELAPSLAGLTSSRLVLGQHSEDDFKNADLVVVNPAVKPDNRFVKIARVAGADITTEVGLVLRLVTGPLLTVTGTNGKSTTTSLLGSMLRKHDPDTLIGGNLGGSLLPLLKDHRPSAPVVLELSSFQLHYLRHMKFRPDIAVVTNLSPDHLDWHRTVLKYYETKRILLHKQSRDNWTILNGSDGTLRQWGDSCPGRPLFTAIDDPETPNACFAAGDMIRIRLQEKETDLAPVSTLKLPGEHNLMNALQAAAAAWLYSRNTGAVKKGMKSFTSLPHRLESIGTVDGIQFVNDSKATTPESTILALKSFEEPVVLIAGGYDKGVSFEDLGSTISSRKCKTVLIGDSAPAIKKAIGDCDTIEAGSDFQKAVQLAKEAATAGGVVLLSPGCASFDMFSNFEERGNRFREIVEGMPGA